jgi:archaellum component FlaF (FlaF/FlaG flagellin family)
MLQTIQGIYKNGKIQLTEIPNNISESKVLVTFMVQDKKTIETRSKNIMSFGMFLGDNQSTEADFKEAEYTINFDDNLD